LLQEEGVFRDAASSLGLCDCFSSANLSLVRANRSAGFPSDILLILSAPSSDTDFISLKPSQKRAKKDPAKSRVKNRD
jgi:hypothetical protein